MSEALRIVILGAECTGKSELTLALRDRLAGASGLRVAAVPEWLRDWCDTHQRTPLQHEQAAIAAEQQRRIEAASAQHDIVVCDTSSLMTAVYSIWYFADQSLLDPALEALTGEGLVLLTAWDVPWQADGVQRDGAHVREPIDDLLRTALMRRNVPFTVIQGLGKRRSESAFEAASAWLHQRGITLEKSSGLFTALLSGNRSVGQDRRRSAWSCECCVPAAEQATFRQQRSAGQATAPPAQFKAEEPGA